MSDQLDKLHKVLKDSAQLLILPHNDPDPDAIATALGLRYLAAEKWGIEAHIKYRGIIGRSENKALVRYLNHPLTKLVFKEIRSGIPIALVDTQPGAGNNPLPEDVPAAVVVDHHTLRDVTATAKFADVRPEIGASSTIMTEYLKSAGLDISPHLATALFYGIKTDTMGLGRGASRQDVDAYFFLQPKVDVAALVDIEQAPLPITYFQSITHAIHAAQIYDGDLVFSYLGQMNYPDLGAEVADILLRLQDVVWVFCMGVYEQDLIVSIRSRSRHYGAGDLACQIVGDLGTAGGHGTMAGGEIHLDHQEPYQLSLQLAKFALEIIKGDANLVGTQLV